MQRMLATRAVLGGEQSGHVLLLDHAPTGDGLLTGLHLLSRVAETRKPLAELAGMMTRFPQVLVAVRVDDKQAAMSSQRLTEAIAAAEHELGDNGRVLVRPSGTEPVIRVMVEAADRGQAQRLVERIASRM